MLISFGYRWPFIRWIQIEALIYVWCFVIIVVVQVNIIVITKNNRIFVRILLILTEKINARFVWVTKRVEFFDAVFGLIWAAKQRHQYFWWLFPFTLFGRSFGASCDRRYSRATATNDGQCNGCFVARLNVMIHSLLVARFLLSFFRLLVWQRLSFDLFVVSFRNNCSEWDEACAW